VACVSVVVRFEPKAVWLDKFLFEAVIFGFRNSWFRGQRDVTKQIECLQFVVATAKTAAGFC
jgi:hypothetical protein